ncbi:hypothetical protein FDP22_10340 [Paroceanicella profunda]|uniref:Uncharacterized protein n=1 Tax=Paroceanicella profunda TaxID=2579971 RepID=A0A5B8FX31_9RHOB|nr:hypothetical protein [Paroceanicella profunda]QDL92134.1 hypothetical protein FDP22_10340 [Paroceanicella profunda]
MTSNFYRTLGTLLTVLVISAVLTPAQAQVERLKGTYLGVAEAQGMRLDISPSGGGLHGRFTDSNGTVAEFDAPSVGTAAETVIEFPQRKVKIRIFPEAVGLRMIAIPLDANGQPVIDETNALVFLPPDVKVPEVPSGYQPPTYRKRVVDPDTFLISYPFWPPEGVAFGYESLEARYRPLFGLFPVVMTDVLWKLCSSSYKPGVLGEALRGQNVTCDQVLRKIDEVQRRGRFAAYKARVAKEADVLMTSVQCARGYIVKPEICRPAAKRVSDAAISMNTVSSVLSGL